MNNDLINDPDSEYDINIKCNSVKDFITGLLIKLNPYRKVN
jgi:hypothetical protein